MDSIRILVCAPVTVPYKSGAGLNAFNLSKEYAKQGHQVTLLSLRWGGERTCEYFGNVKVIRCPYMSRNRLWKVLSYGILLPLYTLQVLMTQRIVIFGPVQGYLYLITLGRLLRKPVVFRSTMLGVDDVRSLVRKAPRPLRSLKNGVLGLMHGYFAQNPAMAQIFREMYSHKCLLMSPQGVDTDVFHPSTDVEKSSARHTLGLPSLPTKVLLSVGCLIERKGYREVFEALARIHETDFFFVVIGTHDPAPGHYLYDRRGEMEALRRLGETLLGNRVAFLGEVDQVHEYYRASDLFILNSSKEGTPNVLLEAMACGLPIVVSEIEGIHNYLTHDDENCRIIHPGSDIAAVVRELLEDDDHCRRLAMGAVRTIGDGYSLRHVGEQILQMTNSRRHL
jgi:glycosyltransferase involved in cell wall biosynthesis